MKSLIQRYCFFGVLLLLVVSSGVFAQDAQPSDPSGDQDVIASCLSTIGTCAAKSADNSTLSLQLDRIDRVYTIDSRMTIIVKSSQPGYLYLLDETSTGQIILLLPNRFLPGEEPIEAGKLLTYPAPKMNFNLTVTAPCGREKVYAFVTKEPVEAFQNAIGDVVALLAPDVARKGLTDIVNQLNADAAQVAIKDFEIREKKYPTGPSTDSNAESQEPLTVVLEHSGSLYIDGEYLFARVTSQRTGYLYVLVETDDENGAVLLPNKNCEEYRIEAGQSLLIPSKEDAFRWRIATKNFGIKKISFWLMSKPIDLASELNDSEYLAKVELSIETRAAAKK
ncbi:MAG: DUF4384 domain-containing protein [Planctomycetia bacterium]|nr:DUF4384 domain-containing protein [Planctomycetia bacterium]